MFPAAHLKAEPSVSVRPASPGTVVRTPINDADNVVVMVDGRQVSVELAQVQHGLQVMVWLRELERLGWGVIEVGSGGEILFHGKGVVLAFTKGQGVAKVNSLAVRLPVDTYSDNGKLMVPLSFVAKSMGFEYETGQKTVVSIRTTPRPKANSITGRVLFNGKAAPGITIRAADEGYNVVKGVVGRTDSKGDFVVSPLPDGKYMAYVYTGDNPLYFNRASETVDLKGGSQIGVKPIALGRIIGPVKPKSGSKVSLAKPSVDFSWEACPGAAAYRLHIGLVGKLVPDIDVDTKKPFVSVSSKKFSAGLRYSVEVTALDASGGFLGGSVAAGSKQWSFDATK